MIEAELVTRLASAWYGIELDAADAAGLAAALAPVEAAMREAEGRIGFEDMTPARFEATMMRLADV